LIRNRQVFIFVRTKWLATGGDCGGTTGRCAQGQNPDRYERLAVAIDLNLSGQVLSEPFREAGAQTITVQGAI